MPTLEEQLAELLPKPIYVHCEKCGHPFLLQREDAKYCSDECRNAAAQQRRRGDRQLAKCPVCDKHFLQRRLDQQYCSDKCRSKAQSNREATREMRVCLGCGNDFFAEDKRKVYCSPACYQKSNAARWEHKDYRKRNMEKRFVAWDGEGEDGKYTLLANSDGDTLIDRDGLSTYECLEFLLNHTSRAQVNVWFSFGYDVSMILKDIPIVTDDGLPSLQRLHSQGHIKWRGYSITYYPRKKFIVNKNGRSFVSYDTFGFFQTGFINVCESWLGSVPEVITTGKKGREDFKNWDMDRIVEYNKLECEILVETMDKFRDSLEVAGLTLKSWHGPAAIAKEWLKLQGIKDHITEVPEPMRDPVMRAYFGGRIEIAGWGHAERVWHYDINSAYPRALCEVPSLANIEWVLRQGSGKVDSAPTNDFALVHVRWQCRELYQKKPFLWGPFPYRDKTGGIMYPQEGEGWYWNVEVKSAQKRFGDKITVLEWWEPEGELVYPFREPLMEVAERRLKWKKEKNPANIPLKLMMNSLYGVFAEKKGHLRDGEYQAPPFQCHAWAGFVTAYCRAMVNDAIGQAQGHVVLVMTDSLWSLVPMDLDCGDKLGQWSYEEADVSADFCGAGLYQSYDEQGNLRPKEYKSRGFSLDQGDKLEYAEILKEWAASLTEGEWEQRKYKIRRFVGIGLAVMVPQYRERYGEFIEIEKKLTNVAMMGQSKRLGYAASGRMPVEKGIHWMLPTPVVKKGGRADRMMGGELAMGVVDWGIECSHPYRIGKMEADAGPELREHFADGEDQD